MSIWGHKNERLSRIETLKVPFMVQTRDCESVQAYLFEETKTEIKR
jgi:hypothetical protein